MKRNHMIIIVAIVVILGLLILGINSVQKIKNTQITDNNSNDVTFCLDNQRDGDSCVEIYQPVCATVNVQCIQAPCDPAKETYPNSCFACKNKLVSDYAEGEC